jgi:hypothetical protein
MNIARRSLYVTVKMLRSAGVDCDARFIDGKIYALLSAPKGSEPWAATFEKVDAARAANWLVACVVHFYPKSDIAKVWRLIAEAAASAERSDG